MFCTIIIPTYNRGDFLHQTLDSVMLQDTGDWEVIVVDDGSTDDTKAVVQSFEDDRVRYVWQKNSERGAARNHGVKLARGDYVYLLDSRPPDIPLPRARSKIT